MIYSRRSQCLAKSVSVTPKHVEGFGNVYGSTISDQKAGSIVAAKGTPEYWNQVINAQQRGVRTRNSLVAAQRIADGGGEAVPSLIHPENLSREDCGSWSICDALQRISIHQVTVPCRTWHWFVAS